MTVILRRSARVIFSAILAGLVVWWLLILLGIMAAVIEQVRSTGVASLSESLSGSLSIAIIGTLYAIPISLAAGLSCLPSALLAIRWFGRPGVAGPWTFTIGGTVCALATAVMLWLVIWANAALASPVPLNQAVDWLYPLLWLAVGGPLAGFIYWRLARREILAVRAETTPG